MKPEPQELNLVSKAIPEGAKRIREHLDQIKKERAQYIEMFAAAFLEQVGSKKASRYQLTETVTHDKDVMTTKWSFEKRR